MAQTEIDAWEWESEIKGATRKYFTCNDGIENEFAPKIVVISIIGSFLHIGF